MKTIIIKSLKFRLGFIVGLLVSIALVITISIFINNTRKLAFENAKTEVASNAENSVINISNEIDMAIREINLTMQKLNDLKKLKGVSRENLVDMLKKQMNNQNYLGIYANWEPDKFDGRDEQYRGVPGFFDDGRFSTYWYLENDSLLLQNSTNAWSEEMANSNEWYEIPKKTKKLTYL